MIRSAQTDLLAALSEQVQGLYSSENKPPPTPRDGDLVGLAECPVSAIISDGLTD
jgi:hypothetical protein